ncbi:MAG: imidazolonepropionase-like domain-containing protein [Gemmatimonadaceae bacterium]
MLIRRSLLLALGQIVPAASGLTQDAIYTNGRFVTLNAAGTNAQAVAVRNGRIIAVGTAAEIRRLAASRMRVIDMGGKTVIPGFYDNHVHLGEDLQEWKGGMIGAVPEWLTGVETMAQLLPAIQTRRVDAT